jgi:hypothetical protein
MLLQQVGAEFLYAERETDRYDEANGSSSQFFEST